MKEGHIIIMGYVGTRALLARDSDPFRATMSSPAPKVFWGSIFLTKD